MSWITETSEFINNDPRAFKILMIMSLIFPIILFSILLYIFRNSESGIPVFIFILLCVSFYRLYNKRLIFRKDFNLNMKVKDLVRGDKNGTNRQVHSSNETGTSTEPRKYKPFGEI